MIRTYIFISQIAHYVNVGSRIPNELPFEEGNVNDGGVEVDELEDENFKSEIIIKVWLSSVHFWNINGYI